MGFMKYLSGVTRSKGSLQAGIGVVFVLAVLLDLTSVSLAQISSTTPPVAGSSTASNNESDKRTCDRTASPCKKGVLIPLWSPTGDLSVGDKAARATVYMTAIIYMFLGVSIIADRFMAAIEVITSKEKEVVIKKPNGVTAVVNVRIWNETVSNLTLMALGSSAPEILLSIIEICGNKFQAGDLGPSTIVGSAAFNLFVIIGLCVYCIPNGEVRRIKHLRVFFITATWSVFAYLWLYFILSISSVGVVDLWEAGLTLLFFPATVATAYVADRKILIYKFLSKKYRTGKRKGVVIQTEGDAEMAASPEDDVQFKGIDAEDSDVKNFEQHRNEFIEIMRELRKKNPNLDMKALEEMAEYEAVNRGPKSRAFYRIQATRKLTGGGNVIKKAKIERRASVEDVKVEVRGDPNVTKVFFDPGHYTVMENVGTFNVTVSREGGDLSKTLYVDYKTEDGTANAGSDYMYAEGTLVFQPEDIHKQFPLAILDDDIFEEDEHFYIRLSNLRLGDSQGMFESGTQNAKAELDTPFMATVMILDDDHPGIFHFDETEVTITESVGEMGIRVVRSSGARGIVKVPYHAVDGTAKAGRDYEVEYGELTFDNDATEQEIRIRIIDDEEYEKSEHFTVILDEPYLVRKGSDEDSDQAESPVAVGKYNDERLTNAEDPSLADMAKPRLGDITNVAVTIKESLEFKSVVDKLLKKANVSLVVGTSSWREQFSEAITVSAVGQLGDEDESDEDAEEKLPSCMDYVMHFLTLFWKVLFACVPPTDYWGGWACFLVSISVIGFLTALIGDLASSFGCTVGLKDSVTAISFVALGTSVPDTFASKVAAVNDKYADSSVGNVTGSNAVNVFLGIGIAWTIAAVYWAIKGEKFTVDPGSLAVSVTVFCCLAVVAIAILVVRRQPFVGGELGGPTKYKYPTAIFLVSLWLIYLLISSFVAYCYIPTF
ncbi:sodium/calcium exchanger 3-like isoform X1 [Haliotis cracherodii]|uniref:sodium/calcium exchanger 3-like isoform X1 n=1 Tax=Haliotis cracherodii TaxID=6455 RepID=UPI0039EB16D2